MSEIDDAGILAAPCGLYCGICADNVSAMECHGCGCTCGQCAGGWHYGHCALSQCVSERKIESCADCDDFPCTKLIQFTRDPVWTTHSVCIDNLHRRRKLGTDAWVAEQKEFYSDEGNRRKEMLHHDICSKRSSEWN